MKTLLVGYGPVAGLSQPKRLGCTGPPGERLTLVPTDGQALLIKGIPAQIRDGGPILDGGHGGVRESPWLGELQRQGRKPCV